MRRLPDELRDALRRARNLESIADTPEHRRAAAHGTAALLLAGADAGWTVSELSAAGGISQTTVKARIIRERRRRGGRAPGLAVPPVPVPAPSATAIRRLPVDERDWLTRREACQLIGIHTSTLAQWTRAGLLPNTWRTARTHFLYHRGDLNRVANAPRRGKVGLDRKSFAAQVRAVDNSETVTAPS